MDLSEYSGDVDSLSVDGRWADVGGSGVRRVHPSLVIISLVKLRDRLDEAVSWGRIKFEEEVREGIEDEIF